MFTVGAHVPVRLTIAIWIALSVSGCGGSGSQIPSAASAVQPAPTPSPGPSPTGSYAITGLVVDEAGRPIEGATVDACCVGGYPNRYSTLHGTLLTDETGHYSMTGIPAAAAPLWLVAYKDGYVEQCAVDAVVTSNLAMDIALVSRTNLTSMAMSAPGLRSVVGVVVRMTGTEQPVTGALVVLEQFEDFEPAFTYTDQNGRFALCGLPTNDTLLIGAGMTPGAQPTYTNVRPGQTVVQIVLR